MMLASCPACQTIMEYVEKGYDCFNFLQKNALFAVQIQICQLVAEPCDLIGTVIHAGHVGSIACFYH